METKFCILFTTIFCLNLLQFVENASSNEALIECGNVHHIEMHNFSNAVASYSNSKCALVCAIGNDALPVETLNQGKSCPEDTSGICHNGHCIGGVEDALRVCSIEHSLDFNAMKDHLGTAFTNAQCMLKCVIRGKEWSINHMHEGSPCPANPNGVCRIGTCVTQSTNPETIVTQSPTTVTLLPPTTVTPPPPTTATKPSIDSFSASKIKFLNISLDSANPPLKPTEHISLYFYPNGDHPNPSPICKLYNSSTQANFYDPQVISEVLRLNKASQMSIDLYELINSITNELAEEHVNLYSSFASFYHNHKITFGEMENFVENFSIHRIEDPHNKLMDIGLRFTIVFSKD